MTRDENRPRNQYITRKLRYGENEGFFVRNLEQPIFEVFGYNKEYKLLLDGRMYECRNGSVIEGVQYKKAQLYANIHQPPLAEAEYNVTGKRVYIHLDSFCLGDVIAWMPQVHEYYKQKKPAKLFVSTWFPEIFDYDDITPIGPYEQLVGDLYAFRQFGYRKEYKPHRRLPLGKICSEYLGVDYQLSTPNIKRPNHRSLYNRPYVVIAPESKKEQAKWLYPNGWQKVTDYLVSLGYLVVNVSAENTLDLNSCVNKNGFLDLSDRINDIYHSEFFLGVSSGLSWLAWALKKQVIMVSGFTLPINEFKCHRVINTEVCHGCWNKTTLPGTCPFDKDFECSREIHPNQVFDKISLIHNQNQV